MGDRTLRRRVAASLLLAALALPVAAAAKAGDPGRDRQVHMNEIQLINTHDSYHRELGPAEKAMFDSLSGRPGAYDENLGYSHLTLAGQLSRQNVRGLEIDLFPDDPQGGRYATPLLRRLLDLGPLPDPDWRKPGIKVMHVADVDYNTSCVLFTTCLAQIKSWSDAHAGHLPVFVMLELKRTDNNWASRGGVTVPAWDGPNFEEIDREILSMFDRRDLITPDDIRRRGLTVNESMLRFGWPSLADSRGKVMFFFNNVGNTSAYTEGHPNLEGRVLFPNANPGESNSAYRGRDEIPQLVDEIRGLVEQGYIVRTRADVSLGTARQGDETRVQQALASGAQLVSTDFPTEGMSARYNTDFVAQLPDGAVARCNPVNAPRACRDDRLEPRFGRGARRAGR